MVNGNDILEYEQDNAQWLMREFSVNHLKFNFDSLDWDDFGFLNKNFFDDNDYWRFVEEQYGQQGAF